MLGDGEMVDAVDGNFEVPARMIGAMKEGRAVGASSCGQLFIMDPLSQSSTPIRVSQSPARHVACGSVASQQGMWHVTALRASKACDSDVEPRGSEFDSRREHFFFYRAKCRVEHTFFWNRTHSVKTT
jgi:hypothetical protein